MRVLPLLQLWRGGSRKPPKFFAYPASGGEWEAAKRQCWAETRLRFDFVPAIWNNTNAFGCKSSMKGSSNKPLVYLETSFVSYLVSRVSSKEDVARKQAATHRWWEEESAKYSPVVSEAVWNEALDGDESQVSLRTEFMRPFPSLAITPEAERLANELLLAHAIPPNSTTDALHVALATVYGARLLLTWNCRHIANSETLPKTVSVIQQSGYQCPAIATPAQRLEERYDD